MSFAFIVFMIFFMGLVLLISYRHNKRKNGRCTAQTQGVLKDIRRHEDSDGVDHIYYVYTFNVDGIEYEFKGDASPEAHDVGDSCTIWYNPKKPKDAQPYHSSDRNLKLLRNIGLGLILLGMLLTIFAIIR